ncbi:uncharacterized protein LOC135389603 [Ornithodoros turicata]|uniref:uncharacterized protein LOC135389603 n=1 Tax=Ornithodoros turicata TaxID=34597 RepID=UPI0031397623
MLMEDSASGLSLSAGENTTQDCVDRDQGQEEQNDIGGILDLSSHPACVEGAEHSQVEDGYSMENDTADAGPELEEFTRTVGIQVDSANLARGRQFQLLSISTIADEDALRCVTGIGTFDIFYMLADLYTEIRLLQSSRSFCVANEDAILLTFVKLYHNVSSSLLAVLFGVHRTTASNIFKESVQTLAAVLQHAIFQPTKEAVLACLTKYFQRFSSTRMILDCTEIPLQQPTDLASRLLTYSHYKKTHTVKILVCETPGGLISYLSPAYGGRTSDTHITKESKVLETCEPHIDSVMVDKGFLIDDLCSEHAIKLIRPPFLKKKKQFSPHEAEQTQSIASARVHVERAIQRMKLFKILQQRFPLELLPYINDITTIVAALANIGKPIFSENKFLFTGT